MKRGRERKGPRKIGGRFVLHEVIGNGNFGKVYRAEHVISGKEFAVKIESNSQSVRLLRNEEKLYKVLESLPGVPKVNWCGCDGDDNVLAMDLLGKSLEQLLQKSESKKFSLKTVLMIADQVLGILQFIHNKDYIYRDVKPDNFLIGLDKKDKMIHIVDFGLATKYRDTKTSEHIKYKEDKELTGTARYVSINTHMGIEQSRRDDMESLGYMLVYLLKGSLPWQGIDCPESEKMEQIAKTKMVTSYQSLCEGLPREFRTYFETVRALGFQDEPPYAELRANFRNLFVKRGYVFDGVYDWSEIEAGVDETKKKDTLPPVHAPLFDNKEVGLTDETTSKLPALDATFASITAWKDSVPQTMRKVRSRCIIRKSAPTSPLNVKKSLHLKQILTPTKTKHV